MNLDLPKVAFWAALTGSALVVTPALAFGPGNPVPWGMTFTCTPTHVWDGDGANLVSGRATAQVGGDCSAGTRWTLLPGPSLSTGEWHGCT